MPGGSLDGVSLPWNWIGPEGVGQRPMTQSQADWLRDHGVTRGQYMAELRRRGMLAPDSPTIAPFGDCGGR